MCHMHYVTALCHLSNARDLSYESYVASKARLKRQPHHISVYTLCTEKPSCRKSCIIVVDRDRVRRELQRNGEQRLSSFSALVADACSLHCGASFCYCLFECVAMACQLHCRSLGEGNLHCDDYCDYHPSYDRFVVFSILPEILYSRGYNLHSVVAS